MRDVVQQYIVKQHKNPSMLYIWIISLYLSYLKRTKQKKLKETAMLGKKNKQAVAQHIHATERTQMTFASGAAIAIAANILMHTGLVTAGYILAGIALFVFLSGGRASSHNSKLHIPGVAYA